MQRLHSSPHANADLENPENSQLVLADGGLKLADLFSWRFPLLSLEFLMICTNDLDWLYQDRG